MKRIAIVVGTRPDVIKMSPVARAMRGADGMDIRVIGTGQHREMMAQAAEATGTRIDRDLDLMRQDQTLVGLTSRILEAITAEYLEWQPDIVLVQGDTTTAFTSALAAFYLQIPIGHVEAGLRTWNMRQPFPEEASRKLIAPLASLNFAPTEQCRRNLLAEGITEDTIHVTGNTVVDALLWASHDPRSAEVDTQSRTILVTAHRRESWDSGIEQICLALRDIVDRLSDMRITFPVHPNPRVKNVVERILGDHNRVALIDPPDYYAMIGLLRGCTLVMTDSGGLQEEAPTFGKPLIVMRETTERPEGVAAGVAKLVGADRAKLVAAAVELLTDTAAYERMAKATNPYGDGHAAERITHAVREFLEMARA